MSFWLVPKSVTVNCVMVLILRYFTEFGIFRGALCKSGWRCHRKKFTFDISSPDEFLVMLLYRGNVLPSVLWNCWLGIGKNIRLLKKVTQWVLAWFSLWSEMQMISICHYHPVISCFIKIQNGLTFLVQGFPDCPGKEAIKRQSVCMGECL